LVSLPYYLSGTKNNNKRRTKSSARTNGKHRERKRNGHEQAPLIQPKGEQRVLVASDIKREARSRNKYPLLAASA
jgi:hypothetical protein